MVDERQAKTGSNNDDNNLNNNSAYLGRSLTPRQQVTLPRSWRFWKRGDSPTTRRARCRAQSGRPTSSRLRCPQSSTNRCSCRAPLFLSRHCFLFVHGLRIPLSIFTRWRFVECGLTVRIDLPTIVKKVREANIWHQPMEKPMKVRELWKGLLGVYFNGGEKERERERYPINLPNGIRLGATYRVHGIFPWFVCSNFLRRKLPSYNGECNEIRVRWIFLQILESFSLSTLVFSNLACLVFWFWRLISLDSKITMSFWFFRDWICVFFFFLLLSFSKLDK